MKYILGILIFLGILLSFMLTSMSIKDLAMLPGYELDDRVVLINNGWISQHFSVRNDLVAIANPKEKDPPIQKRTKLIRRIIAKSGDQLEIRNRLVLVNGTPLVEDQVVFTYRIVSTLNVEELKNQFDLVWVQSTVLEGMYDLLISPGKAKDLEASPSIQQVRLLDDPRLLPNKPIFPFSERNIWTLNDYGPLTIPGKGYTIELNQSNLDRFRMILTNYEGLNIEESNGIVKINEVETRHYTFTKDYYFVLSDNRDFGEDSRTFGILPQEYLIGKIILSF